MAGRHLARSARRLPSKNELLCECGSGRCKSAYKCESRDACPLPAQVAHAQRCTLAPSWRRSASWASVPAGRLAHLRAVPPILKRPAHIEASDSIAGPEACSTSRHDCTSDGACKRLSHRVSAPPAILCATEEASRLPQTDLRARRPCCSRRRRRHCCPAPPHNVQTAWGAILLPP